MDPNAAAVLSATPYALCAWPRSQAGQPSDPQAFSACLQEQSMPTHTAVNDAQTHFPYLESHRQLLDPHRFGNITITTL